MSYGKKKPAMALLLTIIQKRCYRGSRDCGHYKVQSCSRQRV